MANTTTGASYISNRKPFGIQPLETHLSLRFPSDSAFSRAAKEYRVSSKETEISVICEKRSTNKTVHFLNKKKTATIKSNGYQQPLSTTATAQL